MGWIKNLADSLFFVVLFYLALGFLMAVHGHNVPEIAFTPMAVLTMFIYISSQVTNYRF